MGRDVTACANGHGPSQNKTSVKNHSRRRTRKESSNVWGATGVHVEQPAMPGQTAKLMLRFIDRIRVVAAHDMACEPDQNPLQRAYEGCVSKLSDEERGELVRIINKLSQQLEEQELRLDESARPALSAAPGRSRLLTGSGTPLPAAAGPQR